jgi:signal peptidase I
VSEAKNVETADTAAYNTGVPVTSDSLGTIIAKTHLVFGTQLPAFLSALALWFIAAVVMLVLFPLIPLTVWIVLGVVQVFAVYSWSQGALFAIALAACQGRPIGPLAALREVWRNHLGHMIVSAVLVFIGTMLGLILLIVPGIIFLLRCGLIYPAVVLAEGIGGFRALGRCREITRKRTWKIIVLFGAFTLIEAAAKYLVGENAEIRNLLQISLSPLAAVWGTLFYLGAAGGKLDLRQSRFAPSTDAWVGAAICLVFASLMLHPRIFLQAYTIPAKSMVPTLTVGDHLIANNFAYGFRWPGQKTYNLHWSRPSRGDLVIFPFPEDRSKDFIKRVIAVGGETVEIRQKRVYINGKAIDDPYAHFETEGTAENVPNRDNFGPQRVPENHIFVLGDNRNQSYDSRFWGFVNIEDVTGKAHVIYWSLDQQNRTVRWDRIGKLLD